MDTLEKTIDWTPMTESSPLESDSYLVTRKDPLLTTTAFYEHGEWWDGPLCEWAWPGRHDCCLEADAETL